MRSIPIHCRSARSPLHKAPRLNTVRARQIRIPNSEFRNCHRSFTLIELLVVITIIAILATLTLQVAGGLITQARDAATKATINKIQALMNSRAQAFHRLTMRKGYLAGSSEFQKVQQTWPSLALTTQKIIAMKELQKRFFPQTQAEVATYAAVYPTTGNNVNAANIDVLYDFLTQANVLGEPAQGTDSFNTSETKDTNGNSLPEFVDAWGNPIRFYRWPTRLFRSGGQTGASGSGAVEAITQTDTNYVKLLFSTLPVFTGNLGPDPNLTLYPSATGPLYNTDLDRDPDDPLRECQYNYTWFEKTYHTPATFHVFLIVSAGPDGILGLYEPDDATNYGTLGAVKNQQALTDDIISLNIRAGGK